MDAEIWRTPEDVLGDPQLVEINARSLACVREHVGLYAGICSCKQASSLGILIMADVEAVACALCNKTVELVQIPHYVPVQDEHGDWHVIIRRHKKRFPPNTTNIFQSMEA